MMLRVLYPSPLAPADSGTSGAQQTAHSLRLCSETPKRMPTHRRDLISDGPRLEKVGDNRYAETERHYLGPKSGITPDYRSEPSTDK